jgi:hypothetical protein
LVLKSDLSAIWTIELATKDSCTAEQCVVALNFPALDGGDIECQAPNGAAQEQDQTKKNQRIRDDQNEQMRELQSTWAKILVAS